MCSPRYFFRAISTTKAPVAQELCSGLILMNKRVSGHISLVFATRGGDLRAG
jgi:hypothetical protein